MERNENGKAGGTSSNVRIAQGRSPAYPYIDLEKAIERADQIRAAGATRQAMPSETFYSIWKFGSLSSGARQTLAALNHFGLVDYIGRGDTRKVKLSDTARKIVLDKTPDSPDRLAAIREAALAPSIHHELFEKYGQILPDAVVLMTYLTRDRGYNERAARYLIDEYKTTLEYAGLDKPENTPGSLSDADPGMGEGFKVGDDVNWVSQDQVMWLKPWKITEIAEHDDGGQYLKVEGAGPDEGKSGWIPMNEALNPEPSAHQVGTHRTFAPPPPSSAVSNDSTFDTPKPKGARREVFALEEGDVILTYPNILSKESYDDLKGYLDLFLKKARRRAGVPEPK